MNARSNNGININLTKRLKDLLCNKGRELQEQKRLQRSCSHGFPAALGHIDRCK